MFYFYENNIEISRKSEKNFVSIALFCNFGLSISQKQKKITQMKRIITIVAFLALFGSANATNNSKYNSTESNSIKSEIKFPDWREGQWKRNVPEHLLSVNIAGSYTITPNYVNTNPFGAGLTLGYQYKTRGWKLNPQFTTSFGGYSGVLFYRGASVERNAEGARHEIIIDRLKTYTYVPLMLNANIHYDFNKTSIYLGVDAGVNMMIGEKDFEQESIIYIQKNFDEIKVTRFVPTAKAKLGFMQEVSPNIRLKFNAGISYEMGYKDDFNGAYINGGFVESVEMTDLKQADSIDPFAEFGLVISL